MLRLEWIYAAIGFALTVLLGQFIPEIAQGRTMAVSFDWAPTLGVKLSFYLDGLSLLFSLLITSIGSFVLIYSGSYLRGHHQLNRLVTYLFFFMLVMLGLVLSDNILILFVFWELTSILSYMLIGFDHENVKARKSALQALVITGAGGLAMLAGFILIGEAVGSYELTDIVTRSDLLRVHPYYRPILFLIILGSFTKSAQFPFHIWLPNAMAAPSPVSAYLHSATMVKAGIYLLARLHPEIGGTPEWAFLLQTCGGITAVWGSIMALRQTDMKVMLAYTTLMALGTLTMFLGSEAPSAIAAAVTFILVHSLYKSALFLMVGIVDHECGTRRLDKLGGLAWYMPITAGVAAVAGFSMAGFPPFLGFIGKELKYEGALALSTTPGLIAATALAANAMMTAAALTIAYKPFHGKLTTEPPHEAPAAMWIGPTLFAGLGLLFGLVPSIVSKAVVRPALIAFFGQAEEVKLALFHGFNLPMLLSILTLALGSLIFWKIEPIRNLLIWAEERLPITINRLYELGMSGLLTLARGQTDLLQGGSLQRHFLIIFSTFTILVGSAFLYGGGLVWPGEATAALFGQWSFREWAPLVMIIVATIGVLTTDSRLMSVCALGFIGAGATLIFVSFGAPDVAMTQLLVETLSLIILSLVLWRLPADKFTKKLKLSERFVYALVSLAVGVLTTVMLLAVLNIPLDRYLTRFFELQSLPGGHGRNIVNVILVDFRALDTLGEITVVGMAGLAAYGLLKYVPRGRK